ncbi:PKD domain-containing protein [Pedobacter sp. Du54]|uniref:PKD domain-containing protein n=1 Tax=Pedobacter anseongensis TaxID=3133439 RepID=UPI0030B3F1BB
MIKRVALILLFVILAFVQKLSAQNTSNKGKDFYVAYSGHIDALASRLTLFLSADQATTYQVFVGVVQVSSGSITANTCLPVIIDPNTVNVYIAGSDVIEQNRAIHVVTTKPISLYSVISNAARTGGSMVLPTNTLGKEYYTYSYQSSTTANFAEFNIVATEDATNVEITPTKVERNGKHQANVPFVITLNKGEIYQYQSIDDLSGSYVKSINGCKPIAVFSGNTWASFCEVGNTRNPSGGDNLYQQLFPVSSWGRKFVTAPFYNTTNGSTDILRIIVSEDNTFITVDGSQASANGTPLTNPYAKGSIITFSSKMASVIEASSPISVAQYQTSQTCNLNNPTNINSGATTFPGDPEITVLNPVEQTLNNITVYSKLEGVPTQITKFFINVVIKTIDAASFRLDGNPVGGFIPIDSEYSYRIIDVTNSQPQHRLTASGGFSAIAYGYGNVESYAYLAGANIQDFTFQPELVGTAQSVTNGCVGLPINLKINLPYMPTKLEWDVQNGDSVISEPNPTPIGNLTRNGIVYYTFVYPKPIVYITPNDYTFKVIATKPSADNCGATEELSVDFTVDPLPTAAISVAASGCATEQITFSAASSASNVSGKVLTHWLWDFGDGSPIVDLQNPVHVYAVTATKTFKVTLTVGADNGCYSDVVSTDIVIGPQPLAAFNTIFNGITLTSNTVNSCINTAIAFEDKSTVGAGAKITEWLWDFGDNTTSLQQNPVHSYTTAGTYTVSLLAKSNSGCKSLILQKTLNITDLPINDFILPEVCAKDGIAIFKNLSTDYDKSITGLTSYLWDFGDPASGAQNTSNAIEGNHLYTSAGTYKVILTIKNTNGCTVSLQKDFTVNDSSPVANFEVVNATFCSNKELVLKNTSKVVIGSISRLEWYMDGVKVLSDEEPLPDKLYTFTIPSFGGNVDKVYNFQLIVYSGATCSNQINKPVTIKPSPQISFMPLTPVCENDGIVKLHQGQEQSGLNGIGVYSGKAMATDGTFDPKLAGPGIHTITYTFTGANGCDSTLKQDMMVFESPLADASPSVYILSGGQYKIPAKASGKNVTYKWTPAIGLDHDDVLSPIASPEEDTEYTLTVSTDEGCTVQSKIFIKVLGEVHPPTSFTPNGDGINDVWNILLLDSYPDNTVEIFNRAGQKVFESKGYKVPFDGNFHNKPLPVGVYYYIIAPKSGRKTVTGPLTLIR